MGTEAFWIPALISAVGTGVQAVNQRNATSRANNIETQSITDQNQYRDQANQQVKNLTQQIATDSPGAIASKEEGNFVNTLRKNSAGSTAGGPTNTNDNNFGAPVSALPPAAGASKQYKAAANGSQQETQQYGNTIADEMGNIDAAVRERQNEGLQMQTLGTNLNTLGAESYTKNFVDQLRAQTAGQSNPWVGLFSGILKNGASAAATNGWGAGGSSAAGAALGSHAPNMNLPTVGDPTTNYWSNLSQ